MTGTLTPPSRRDGAGAVAAGKAAAEVSPRFQVHHELRRTIAGMRLVLRDLDERQARLERWAGELQAARRRLEDAVRRSRDGHVPALVAALTERAPGGGLATPRGTVEDRIADYERQLRAMASEITLSEDRERRRLAGELHDEVGQLLAAARMKLHELETGPSVSADRIGAVGALLDEVIARSRSLTFQLGCPVLYELGLPPALEYLAGEFQDRHRLRVQAAIDPVADPGRDDLRGLLYRAARELLFNVVKHAPAATARMSLALRDDDLCLAVEDDGGGFDPAQTRERAAREGRYGLFALGQRVEHAGGRFRIESAPGRGARVELAVPVPA